MKKLVKSFGILSVVILCLSLIAISAAALEQRLGSSRAVAPYGYYNYNGYNTNSCGYNSYNGFRGYDQSRYPGSTEFCTKWVPGHWVGVRIMMPGRWVYRPVWIPGYPSTRYQWVRGFWQTTAYHSRPDVYVWGSPGRGWYGMPYQNYQPSTGGYFDSSGVWRSEKQ